MPRKLVPQRYVRGAFAAAPPAEAIVAAWRDLLADDARRAALERPAALLSEYFRERGRSRLGRIVDTANRMAGDFETVVVVGPSGATGAAAALFAASAHPFYHRLSYGGRGGRPRIVTIEPTLDNDLLQGVLDLVKSADDGHAPGDRWALVVAEPPSDATAATRDGFAGVHHVLRSALGDDGASRRFRVSDEVDAALPALGGATFLDGLGLFVGALIGGDTVALCKGGAWFHEDAKQAAAAECEAVQLAAAVASAEPTTLVAWHHALEPLARRFVDALGRSDVSVVAAYDPVARRRLLDASPGATPRVHLFTDVVRRDRVSIPSPLVAAYDEVRSTERNADCIAHEIRLEKLNDQSLGELCAWFEAVRLTLSSQV